jgi:polysaccharide biosynthesis/export protein
MKKIFFLLFFIILSACASSKKTTYLQGNVGVQPVNFDTFIQPDDQLLIIVSSENPEVAAPYNLKTTTIQSYNVNQIAQEMQQYYIVDPIGNISMPILGNVNVGGLSRADATNKISNILKNGHIKDATINLRIMNFKISVLGEVNKPGVFAINTERVTILEALAMAGDLSIYGKRDNVLLIREKNGQKSFQRIDLTKSDIVSKPEYYLMQNDVLYVEPNKTKTNSSAIGPNISIGISALSLVVTILALTIK